MIMKNWVFQIPVFLAVTGLACFLAAMALPAIQLPVLGSQTRLFGWQATAWAIGMCYESIAQTVSARTFENVEFIVPGAAGILNITFLITPAIHIWWSSRRKAILWLGVASLLGLLLGMIAPIAVKAPHQIALIGYFVWLVGYGFVLGSIVVALVAGNKGTTGL